MSNLGLHPIIATALANKVASKTDKKVPVTGRTESDVQLAIYEAERKRSIRNNIAKFVVGTAIVFAGYKVTKKIIKNKSEQDQSPAVQYAKRLRVAMFPSGTTWLPDGTNETEIMNIAYAVSNDPAVSFSDVQKSYKKLYNDSLSVHLQKELNSKEYAKLLNVLSDYYEPEKDKENPRYYSEGKMVVMTKESYLYKELYDVFSSQTLNKNSIFTNVVTTGRKEKVAFMGYFNKQTRIEIKQVNGAKTIWLNADGVLTAPRTKENLLKYKNAGYKLYNLK